MEANFIPSHPVAILNQFCKQIFLHYSAPDENTKFKHFVTQFLSQEEILDNLDKFACHENSEFGQLINADCLRLSHSDRRLAILLWLKFSKESIAILTGRDTTGAVSTAKYRLKQRLSKMKSKSGDMLYTMLGLDKS